MLVTTSILIGMLALAAIMMAADWYIWEPRYTASDSFGGEQVRHADHHDRMDVRSAA
jgi:hypothetical protein